MEGVSFYVRGTPMPKGSFTRMPHGGMIPAGTVESRKRMDQWRQDIRSEARKAMGNESPYVLPVRLWVEFAIQPPKSIRKRDHGWIPHTKKPDIDKLFRMLSDALTGIVWVDDSQVCYSAVNKVYAWDDQPGATVTVDPIDEDEARRIANTTKFLRDRIRGNANV